MFFCLKQNVKTIKIFNKTYIYLEHLDMDIPLGYHKLEQYCATLAHKVHTASNLKKREKYLCVLKLS